MGKIKLRVPKMMRQAMEECGLSISELAQYLGAVHQDVSATLRGEKFNPPQRKRGWATYSKWEIRLRKLLGRQRQVRIDLGPTSQIRILPPEKRGERALLIVTEPGEVELVRVFPKKTRL